MKTFIYSKKTSLLVTVIKNVTSVNVTDDKIYFYTDDNKEFKFDMKVYKTTTYQN